MKHQISVLIINISHTDETSNLFTSNNLFKACSLKKTRIKYNYQINRMK